MKVKWLRWLLYTLWSQGHIGQTIGWNNFWWIRELTLSSTNVSPVLPSSPGSLRQGVRGAICSLVSNSWSAWAFSVSRAATCFSNSTEGWSVFNVSITLDTVLRTNSNRLLTSKEVNQARKNSRSLWIAGSTDRMVRWSRFLVSRRDCK